MSKEVETEVMFFIVTGKKITRVILLYRFFSSSVLIEIIKGQILHQTETQTFSQSLVKSMNCYNHPQFLLQKKKLKNIGKNL